jgi:two-component system CheB/CheR fusion protein
MSESDTPGDIGVGQDSDSVFDRRDWLQITLASIGDGVITADAQGRVNYLNPVAEALTGWTIAEATGCEVEQVFRIVNETTKAPVEQPVRIVIERGLTVGLGNHTLLIARDGSERPIDDSAAPITDGGGRVVGVVLIFRDITERRQGELRVEAAREYAESIVTTVRQPLIILDAELHVRSANPAFYRTFRVSPADTEGRFIYDLGDRQWDIPALRTLLEEIIPCNSSFDDWPVEHDFESIGPRTMMLSARRFPPEGKYELILLAIEDVTARKRAELALEEADRRKNEFIAVLAHELRNPLNTISNAAQITRDPAAAEMRDWSLDLIDHQVKNLGRLIEDLLDISRISQGKILIRKEAVDLAPIIGRAVDSVSALVEEREQELSVALPANPMRIDADPIRLEQVFVNLLTNAAKYTPTGGRIGLTAEVEGEGFTIRVRDSGEGIAADMLPRIFEMFTQVEASADRSRGGLGIGLSLVKDLVRMHGGAVTATSAGPGKGSEFVVRLPAAATPAIEIDTH